MFSPLALLRIAHHVDKTYANLVKNWLGLLTVNHWNNDDVGVGVDAGKRESFNGSEAPNAAIAVSGFILCASELP